MNNISNLINRFSSNLVAVLKKAQEMSLAIKQQEIKPEFLFAALMFQKGSLSAEILPHNNKINFSNLPSGLIESTISVNQIKEIYLSAPAKKALLKAVSVAYQYEHKYVGTEHLLLGLLEIDDQELKFFLANNAINTKQLKDQLNGIMQNTARFPDLNEVFGALNTKEKIKEKITGARQKGLALDFFGIELTNAKIQQSIDPVIGREEEIQRIIQILCRRTKNNPILLGEAGVGKTAIVEGLAKKILEGNVPDVLHNKKIFTLDMGLLVSGAMFRGEFESRLKQILDEVKENPNIIIFIDEIHMIIGAGAAGGTMDAANLLKPALARGDIRCIGATTFSEYKKSIEDDPALDRRFQPVKVGEPSEEKVIEILRGIKKNYELFHQVEITDEAIKAAVKLSQMYLTDKFLPDKAIDLLDEAAAKIKTQQKPDAEARLLTDLNKKIEEVIAEKQEAVLDENFDAALKLKEVEKGLTAQLEKIKQESKRVGLKVLGVISETEIAQVISQMTKIPITDISGNEKVKLLNLEKIINQKVVGQKEAVKTIAQAVRRSRVGIRNQNQPIGSFIFLGPSGVGKTELAKVISQTLFGHNSLVRIDMSEFSESFNISKLIGSPAGYVGYKEGGKLSEAVKHQPYSVVLLDEIEKAHPDVFNLLLQILDEGHLTDASGKKINFKNTIIVMTSNIGIDSFNQQAEVGFESLDPKAAVEFSELKDKIKSELKDYFRPEFINRLDQVVIFNPLTLVDLEKIVKLKIEELNSRLVDKQLKLELNSASLKWLAKKDFNANFGARAINRNIAEIEDHLAEGILKDDFKSGDVIKVDIKADKLVLGK